MLFVVVGVVFVVMLDVVDVGFVGVVVGQLSDNL